MAFTRTLPLKYMALIKARSLSFQISQNFNAVTYVKLIPFPPDKFGNMNADI
jgi:hypothetical protein